MTHSPQVTVVIPSYNQANFLEETLKSVASQDVVLEAIVVDGGSTDNSLEIIKKYESSIFWWRSSKDDGQAAAINEGVEKGRAPYVCWLNSDDFLLPDGLPILIEALENSPTAPAAYGKCLVVDKSGNKKKEYWTARFSEKHLANRCFIAQPATLIRRSAWEKVGGLDENLHMSLDYDLWWRLYKYFGSLNFTKKVVAATRYHCETKTNLFRRSHYLESMKVVRKYHGTVPLKWYLAWPIRVELWGYYNRAVKTIKNALKYNRQPLQ
jgi:glycosyltransferase involved in cell wall biosynthesis